LLRPWSQSERLYELKYLDNTPAARLGALSAAVVRAEANTDRGQGLGSGDIAASVIQPGHDRDANRSERDLNDHLDPVKATRGGNP
jgi:predicted neutral ceramidase superfamily lipid hydrolase